MSHKVDGDLDRDDVDPMKMMFLLKMTVKANQVVGAKMMKLLVAVVVADGLRADRRTKRQKQHPEIAIGVVLVNDKVEVKNHRLLSGVWWPTEVLWVERIGVLLESQR